MVGMFMSEVAASQEDFGKARSLVFYKHYLPAVAITNSGQQHPDYAGKAQFQRIDALTPSMFLDGAASAEGDDDAQAIS
ncbi:hypothetical protein BE21_09215 [Sorangium cellulosum]|uniref:Uncharacterized protein n=1 Tax=Sorangium cellulosum TaxID=56 RepID=A0A150U203_SORCE|nr:hypothetical protein BE21_09215 [Sorangium cellulosum]